MELRGDCIRKTWTYTTLIMGTTKSLSFLPDLGLVFEPSSRVKVLLRLMLPPPACPLAGAERGVRGDTTTPKLP